MLNQCILTGNLGDDPLEIRVDGLMSGGVKLHL
jgi:hypothetical protein